MSLRERRVRPALPIVIHELTYVLLSRIASFKSRQDEADDVRSFVPLDSVRVTFKLLMGFALVRWESSAPSFADACLAEMAGVHGVPVCSVNHADFEGVVQDSFYDQPPL